MYSDTIKVANKIISDNDLFEIFQKMNDEILVNKKLSEEENVLNEKYEREYQNWTIKDFKGTFKCTFNFYDDTEIEIDNYNTFLNVFNNRLHEVKQMWVRLNYSYSSGSGFNLNYINKYIYMNIYEDKMSIDVKIDSNDDKMESVYNYIKEKILVAPEKYDRVIKRKTSITNKVGLVIGLIPGIIICLLLIIVPDIRELYGNTFVLFPIISIALAFFIGGTISNIMLDKLYKPLLPEKKYAGYDSYNNKSIYKDDIEKFVETSEIIIGKNVNNIKNRKEIIEIEEKYKKYLPYELIGLSVLSIIVVIIAKVFN